MEHTLVVLLASLSGARPLPEHLAGLCATEDFWRRLEDTPEERLDATQLELLAALGLDLCRPP